MLNDLTLRPATTADVPALMALIEQSVRVLQQGDYPPSQIDASIGSAFGIDRQLLSDRTYFVAETPTGELAACGGWSYRKTLCGSDAFTARDSAILHPATDFAKIRAIFVHPNWARQGLGTLILSHCEAAAQAAGFTRFEMGSTITGAKLYALRGYLEREHITIPLPNGEDLAVIRMEKTLHHTDLSS
jgi:N-acetylglutamate synthase-like GNAT family acetyltransferase